MQVFAYKMCNFLKKVFQYPPFRAIFLYLYAMHVVDGAVGEEEVEDAVEEDFASRGRGRGRMGDRQGFAEGGDGGGGLDGAFVGAGIEVLVAIEEVGCLVATTVIPDDFPCVIDGCSLSGDNELIGVVAKRSSFLTGPTAADLYRTA